MTSTSCEDLARRVLAECLAGRTPASLPHELTAEGCTAPLFGILVEGLSDRFEPALCDAYVQLFAPLFGADLARYRRVRQVRRVNADPARIVVLSRITLGADIAVTSVLLDAAKRRFPHAGILFAGPSKNYELFAGDPRIRHAPVDYRRDIRPAAGPLQAVVGDALVIDPDSRMTQLGLLPVCPEDRYCFFESRSYGSDTALALPELAERWAEETFGVSGAHPFLALAEQPAHGEHIAVSLGVGGNPAKRVADPFEERLLHRLSETGRELWIDKGAGGEESARVEGAAPATANLWEGSFAGFASKIASASLYVGYDSAGQHVAAACGVPSITVFAGFPCERMFQRWRPSGPQSTVIRVDSAGPGDVLAQVDAALQLF